MKVAALFLLTMVVFLIVDFTWLGWLAQDLYIREYGDVLRLVDGRLKPNLPAAFVVYTMLVGGVMIFVLPLADHSLVYGLFYGALFGLVTYGIYDFTIYSVFANWSLKITLIDWVWGCVLCSLTSVACVFFNNLLEAL